LEKSRNNESEKMELQRIGWNAKNVARLELESDLCDEGDDVEEQER
jgi:hypothetical protein